MFLQKLYPPLQVYLNYLAKHRFIQPANHLDYQHDISDPHPPFMEHGTAQSASAKSLPYRKPKDTNALLHI